MIGLGCCTIDICGWLASGVLPTNDDWCGNIPRINLKELTNWQFYLLAFVLAVSDRCAVGVWETDGLPASSNLAFMNLAPEPLCQNHLALGVTFSTAQQSVSAVTAVPFLSALNNWI